MNIDKLKYYIGQRLITLTDINVYNSKVPDDATFPYVVFTFDACSYNTRHRKDWILTLDFWEDSNDETDILASAISIKDGTGLIVGLNNSTQNEAEGFYQCTIDFEGELPSLEPDVSRYNQRYIIKVD